MVLMLTARTLEEDIVRGFEAGADDYLTKPYRLRELLARVRALLRRSRGAATTSLDFAGHRVDPQARIVQDAEGREIELTRTEYDLLVYLLRHRDRALTRAELLDEVWGRDVVVDARTVDNFVSNLKKKLRWDTRSTFEIRTIRGVGYRMRVDEA
jgi:DNA-binding response OmpR family regulator